MPPDHKPLLAPDHKPHLLPGMQNKCTTVISHLANTSCSSIKHHRVPLHKDTLASSSGGGGDNTPELRVAHVLSMDALLNVGLDVGQVSVRLSKVNDIQ